MVLSWKADTFCPKMSKVKVLRQVLQVKGLIYFCDLFQRYWLQQREVSGLANITPARMRTIVKAPEKMTIEEFIKLRDLFQVTSEELLEPVERQIRRT